MNSQDDPYFYLQFCKEGQSEAEGLPGLQLGTSYLSCDTQGRVLRLDSFSKLMAPGFRLGWITGAPQLLRHYRQHAYAASQWGSSLAMKVLAGILQGWGDARFEEVVLTTQAAYKQRRDVVLAAAASHLADVATWDVPAAGFFLWVRWVGRQPRDKKERPFE
jgi:DNA-binding transcriptional MocR family regulator